MAQTLLLQNARLIDGITDQPRANMSILITGDRITAIEQRPLTPAPDTQVIDLAGKTVMPGLIDTHVHSTFVGSASLPLFLAAGVTTARDVGGTDCGALAYPPPGFALLREIELLTEAIGSLAALKAVTSVAARYLRKSEDVGSVAPGRYADLLVIDGDPLRDVRDLRKLTTVYRGGVAYDPQALLAQAPKSDFVPAS